MKQMVTAMYRISQPALMPDNTEGERDFMGFFVWLYKEYRKYKIEKSLPKVDPSEKEKVFLINYAACLDAGFTKEQLFALMNLMN